MSDTTADLSGANGMAPVPEPAPAPEPESAPALRSGSPVHWVLEGLRSLVLLRPYWDRPAAGPLGMVLLLTLQTLVVIGVQRAYVEGEATFEWTALSGSWSAFLLLVLAAYVAAPRNADSPAAVGTGRVLSLLLGQSVWGTMLTGGTFAVLALADLWEKMSDDAALWLWYALVAWVTLARLAVLVRAARSSSTGSARRVLGAVLVLGLFTSVYYYFDRPSPFWRPAEEASETQQENTPFLTQEMVERQSATLPGRSRALLAQRPGVIDVYTLTFAPYEGEEVFRRESTMVADVMARRYDASGRGLQLINHRDTVGELPWATPLNLRRAIRALAARMDREEDLLFVYLTSHGASNGELAAAFWPLDVEVVRPEQLRAWLDEAGIRHRVIAISACYSGSWIAPLANDDTLVMTAADAEHTSYGCGTRSELTFFGRAMFDEQIRRHTLDFVQAHATARKVIAEREKEAGKDDGYSNPQIRVGARIGPYLDQLRKRLAASEAGAVR
jgi:hypothetical protein